MQKICAVTKRQADSLSASVKTHMVIWLLAVGMSVKKSNCHLEMKIEMMRDAITEQKHEE